MTPGHCDVETIDGQISSGNVISIDPAVGIRVMATIGFFDTTPIPIESVSSIRFRTEAPISIAAPGTAGKQGRRCECTLADGGVLIGMMMVGGSRTLKIDIGLNEPIALVYDALAAIRFAATDDGPAEAEMQARLVNREPARDLLIVPKGDSPVVLPGALEALGPDGWEFRLPSRIQKAPLDKAYGVVFGVGPTPPIAKSAMVRLASGGGFTADIVSATRAEIRLNAAAFGEVTIPWSMIARIDLRSRRVTILSDLTPTAQSGGSALGVEWPMQKDRNVVGGPMRLAGRTIARGLGVHGGTTLVYMLDGGYEKFSATVGIDDAIGRRGSVVFRVLGDGKELFKTDVLRGGMPSVAVNVDVAGVKKLELFADPADGLDIGDHADWGEARLIRGAESGASPPVGRK